MDDYSPFEQMDGAAADKNCGVRRGFLPETCGACHSRVILHCSQCMIQVSGCMCQLDERVMEIEHGDSAEARAEREERMRLKLVNHGLWLPPA